MNVTDFSSFITVLKDKKKLSYEKLGDALNISPQAVHNWIKRRKNFNWKVEYIISLSKLLNFDFTISNGNIYVKENEEMNSEMNLKENADFSNIVLNNGERATYTVCREYEDYSIVQFYTNSDNVNYDEVPLLMEETMYYDTPEECCSSEELKKYPNRKPTVVYGLINNATQEIEENIKVSLSIHDIETKYFLYYAKTIEVTNDGFEVVHVDKENGIKIVKASAYINIIGDNAYVVDIGNEPNGKNTIIGIAIIPIDSKNARDNYSWQENVKYYYKEYLTSKYEPRYFDGVRLEIKEGDMLKKTGLQDFLDFLEDEEDKPTDTFKIGNILQVFKSGNELVYKNTSGFEYTLDTLNLLKWSII